MPIEVLQSLVGIPYARCGRTPVGLDCWGLVMAASARLGTPIPDYFAGHTDRTVSECQAAVAGLQQFLNPDHWVPVQGAGQPGDVLAFRNPQGIVDHAGVVIDETWFLHALAGAGVVKARRAADPWCRVLAGVYAYRP